MIKYDNVTRFLLLGKKLEPFFPARLPIRKWGNIIVVGKPRSGKSALAKNLVVNVGQFRKVCVFDYNGEWKYHVTKRNFGCSLPLCLVHCKVIDNMVFKISDFNNLHDWVSLGFSGDQAFFMTLLAEMKLFHNDDMRLFMELLHDLPVDKKALPKFNVKYSKFDLSLPNTIHFQSKRSAENRMLSIVDWFWQGVGDSREFYDWNKLALVYDHLIIDLSFGSGGGDVGYARAYCGKILEKLWNNFKRDKWFFVFEEAGILAPNITPDSNLSYIPSSFVRINELIARAPKLDVSIMCITQSENMLSSVVCNQYHIKLIAPCDHTSGKEYDIAKGLKWNPDANFGDGYRTVLLWQTNGMYSVFEPFIPSCKYK